ncbi:hypothetical protein IW261DRAFT_1677866 [Armillaria novae-zelandiae]|uniref:Transmembrane protein n=1 Tax=Armillaria novae-zelandiae TaxID=153914 RepID=A0AA39UH15_9AGAR|nr:hypothetical protein IW261DRAFT_1677866 [Armillaria novae-zelandiae]
MVKHNTTIDDRSPLITYSPAGYWAQSAAEGPALSKFQGNSYTKTKSAGASASFTFNGTGIDIFGTTRWHAGGSYTVNLDGIPKLLNATAPGTGPMENKAVLFNITGLQQKQHTVTVTNANASIYIDSVGGLLRHSQVLELHVCQQICWWWTVGSGESEKEPPPETNDDTDSNFFWHPADAWKNPPSNISQFHNKTGHGIGQLYFLSDAVSIFGTSGPRNGHYTVRLDDMSSWSFSANRSTYETDVMLFHADNLGNGAHTLSLINEDEGGLLEIDYALSYTDPSGAPPKSSDKGGVVTAIVVASVVFIILLFLLRRNKTLWTRLQSGYMVQSQYDWQYPSTRSINVVSTGGNASVFAGNTNNVEARDVMLQRNHQHRPLMSEPQLIPNRPNNIQPLSPGQRSIQPTRLADVRRPEPVRSSTILTASTLVAENGSNMGNTQAMKVGATFPIH